MRTDSYVTKLRSARLVLQVFLALLQLVTTKWMKSGHIKIITCKSPFYWMAFRYLNSTSYPAFFLILMLKCQQVSASDVRLVSSPHKSEGFCTVEHMAQSS